MPDTGEKKRIPQVFVVDSQAFPSQPSGKQDVPRLQLMHLLLAAALLGVILEAGCICHLYSLYSRHTISSDIQKVEFRKAEKDVFHASVKDLNEILPEKTPKADGKPAAFLLSDSAASGGSGILGWRTDGFPMFMKGMDYKNNSLYIQQDGYYYVFSKISHLESCTFFLHKLMKCSESYKYKPMELIQNSRILCVPDKPQSRSGRGNSYLGGIFQLSKGDSVFVMVNNSSLVLHSTYENVFGAFMV
ncbi:tumor necrosis factor ligand superfamily member 14 [Pimephales promelas]|uniref:tumor necrosis factor ligand superfamily member 14 n=1 Tax=Pimephales promelas TaxID=90988 RepID=UPI0019554DDC|nr:tumor necrosis factor ligand superfamily member 14 [Pimephales promelas]